MNRLVDAIPARWRRRLSRLPAIRVLRNRLYDGPQGRGPGPGERRAVVYLPTWASWDVMAQRPHYVLGEFARRGHPVYFVDPRLGEAGRSGGVRLVPSLRDVPARGALLYVHYPPVRAQFRLFDQPAVLYDITDDISIYAEEEGRAVTESARSHHVALIRRADVVAAASDGLAARYRPDRPDLVTAPNGVDLDRFSTPGPRPADMPPPDRPIAGYHGAIADWRFDFNLFERVARAMPDWWFPLIGPVDERARAGVDRLRRLENVLFLGEKPASLIAAYVQAFDVGTMWYPINPVTEAALPMKANEYLAAGIPPVSTPLPMCVAAPGVATAAGPEEYVDALRAARERGADPGYRAVAASHAEAAAWPRTLEPIFAALAAKSLLTVPHGRGRH